MSEVFTNKIIISFIRDNESAFEELRRNISMKYVEYESNKNEFLLNMIKKDMLKIRPLHYWLKKYNKGISSDEDYSWTEL